jgi:hypothetical protein
MQTMGIPILGHSGEDGFHGRRKPGFRSVFFDRRDFGGNGVLGHENDAADPGYLGRIGQALAVISSGEGDNAALALLRREAENSVDCAARFERARALQILCLETEPRPGQTAQRCRVEERSAMYVWGNADGGSPDVVEADGRRFHSLVSSAGLPRRGGDFLCCGDLLQHSSLPCARRCRPCVRQWNHLSCPDVTGQYTRTGRLAWELL